ncbi:ribosomal protein S18-alanine N-acetyltransferase [Candidatus Bathyarchaeota archaeon]|nr:ribosomal protein S18-alanine N-acetyltransferase [Candidatus Bathyarchaeota archaeon]
MRRECGVADAVKIRNATKTDIDGIMEIENSSFEWFDTFPKALFNQYLNEYRDGFYVVVDQSESIVGYAILAEENGNGYLLSIAVHTKSRNRGVATLLMKFLETKCHEKGFRKLMLEVRVDNKPAIEIYRKRGLVEVGMTTDFYGDGADALMMEKTVLG